MGDGARPRSVDDDLFFDVMLHVGTLAAIVIFYRAVALNALKGLLGSAEVAPAYRRDAVIRTGLLAGVATTPLIPLALFLMKWIKKAFERTTATGDRLPDHGGGPARDRLAAAPRRGGKGAGGDDLARCAPDRAGADVRPAAGREPERLDGRRGAGAGVLAVVGRRVQPADRRPRDPRRGRRRN